MTIKLKRYMLSILIVFSAVAFTLFGYFAFSNSENVYAETDSAIFNFDTNAFIEKGRAAESDRALADLKAENGLLHLLNATSWQASEPEGFFFTYTGGNLSDKPVVLGNYEYFKIRMKRVNCANNQILFYLWDDVRVKPRINYLSTCYIGSEFDGKWIDLTISLRTPTVYVRDISSGVEKRIDLAESAVRNLNPTGAITKLRFYFSKTSNVLREAYAEFFGFFKDKATADTYNGNAVEKLERAENHLTTSNLNTEFALIENTEEKLMKLVSYFIEENENVMAELFNYDRYAYPTATEKGFIYFDARLYSGGKAAYVENIKLTIDTVPQEPIMYKFDNENLINSLTGMNVEKYLYNGVMKVVQPDYHQADGFWLFFDTTPSGDGINDAFLMQSYAVLQWRIKFKGQGPNQFFFNNYDSYYLFGIGYEEEVWLTVQLDTSKSAGAVKVLNESTGEIAYYDAPNPSNYSTDYNPPAFRGLSDVFRFNMGRRSDLERWALVDYFAFFPTLEQADAFGFDGKEGVIIDDDNKSESVLYFAGESAADSVKAFDNTDVVSDGGLKLSLKSGNAGDTGFTSKDLTKADAVNMTKYNVLRLELKQAFTGNIVLTAMTDSGETESEIQFNNEKYKIVSLSDNLGTLRSFGVKVKGGSTVTLLYAGFFKNVSFAQNFNYSYATNLSFNTSYVNLTEQSAAYCYSLAEARSLALSLVEQVAKSNDVNKQAKPQGVNISVETIGFKTPTKNDKGKYVFKVVLSVGDKFGVKSVSETLSLEINKIIRYDDSDDFGSRSAVTDFAFGGGGYAETEKTIKNSEIKTVQFVVRSDISQNAYLIGNSQFSVESDEGGDISVKVNGTEVVKTDWLELFNGEDKTITIVFGKNNSYVYENGKLSTSFGGVTFGDADSKLFVAGNPDSAKANFKGYIKEVRVFNQEKSQDYIRRYALDTLYISDSAEIDGSIEGLIGYWRIKESDGGFTNRVDYSNGLYYYSEIFYNGYYHEFTGQDWLVSKNKAAVTLKTVETWIKEDVKDTDNSVIMRNGAFVLGINGNGYAYITDGDNTVTTSVNIKDGNYHHVAFTVDAGTVKFYLDGNYTAVYTESVNTALSDEYYFGCKFYYNAYNSRKEPEDAFIGRIANFKVFSTVRTEEEIKADMNELYKDTNVSGLALNLPFDISKNLVFTDSVSGNNVTINTLNRYKIINEDVSDYITFVAIPDPQDYIVASTDRQNGTWASYDAWRFNNMNLTINNWIIDYKEKENIKAVITLGDLTQNATPLEFNVFAEHMSVLDGLIPYTLILGNHDYQSMLGFGSSTRGLDPFNAAFPYDVWSEKDYYGGSFEEGNMDNTYYLFDFDGDKYLVMCLEFYPRDEVLEWFDYIAKKYSDYKVIVTSHNYIALDKTTENTGTLVDGLVTYGLASLDGASANNGVEMFEKLIKNNPNIIQGINGHVGNCTYLELENAYGDLVMNASFDSWSDTINNEYKTDGIVALCRYYKDGTMGMYLYDTVDCCYYATNYRWEADMSASRGVI